MVIKNKSFQKNRSKLYIVGTPIGNLKDISERALETLKSVDVIYCEDTKNTVKLLSAYNIRKPLYSMHEHNENIAADAVINRVIVGENVAYVSDAGNPLVSDPGSILIKKANENNLDVVTILGPSAFLHALINSGFNTEHFFFYGFLSRDEKVKTQELALLLKREETSILYEAPHRIAKLLKSLSNAAPDRNIMLARELTKLHEEFIFGTALELASIDSDTIIGEIVVVIEGAKPTEEKKEEIDIIKIYELLKTKMSTKDIIEFIVLQYKLKKNDVYKILEDHKKN